MVLRDADVFPPAPHTSVLCQRDMSLEILEGRRERRDEFIVDSFTGKSWGRIGTGRYLKWSNIPPSGMMRSPLKLPEPNKTVIICSLIPQYYGLKIGKMSYEGAWSFYSDILSDWIVIPVGYIEGWLAIN